MTAQDTDPPKVGVTLIKIIGRGHMEERRANMDPIDWNDFVGTDGTLDLPGILAAMTGSEPRDWDEAGGAEGAVRRYVRTDGAIASVTTERGRTSISITDLNGEQGSRLEHESVLVGSGFDPSDLIADLKAERF